MLASAPGSAACVTSMTRKPVFRHMDAAAVPAGPEPITMTSNEFAFWLFTIFLKITTHYSQFTIHASTYSPATMCDSSATATHDEIFHFALPDFIVAIASFGFPPLLSTTWHTYNVVQSTLLRPKPSQVTFLPLTSTMTYR